MMKRILSLLLAGLMLFTLVGCGGSGKGGEKGEKGHPEVTNSDLIRLGEYDLASKGVLEEFEGYSTLTIRDLPEWETIMGYQSNMFGGLNESGYGFYHHEADTLEKGTVECGYDSVYSEKLRPGTVVYAYAFHYGSTLVFFIGDALPDERAMWTAAGAPEEELPEIKIPVFSGDSVAEFIPVCESIDMTTKDYNGYQEDGPDIRFFLPNLTVDQAEVYVQAALDMGYAERERGDMGDAAHTTFCFEGELPNRVQIFLYYYDGTLMVNVAASYYSFDPADSWRCVSEFVDGVPEYEPGFNEKLSMAWQELCWEEMEHLYPGDAIGNGTGTNSSGFIFWHTVKATGKTFSDCVAKAQRRGFTESVEADSSDLYIACKVLPFEGRELPLWVTIHRDGEYFFCAVGLGWVREENYPNW